MNFFARQEAARRKTRVLLAYYLAAVAMIVWAVYFATRFLFVCLDQAAEYDRGDRLSLVEERRFVIFAWSRLWFYCTAGVTLSIIAFGTLWRRASLAEGGAAVARSAGGREINARTEVFHERRLLNIVEETALASGVPIPRVFVLDDERGLNAFAAGFTLHDAAIAVTRAAMEQFSREELQGVVAHEFSHILNGDMRLNSWLLGVLFGILCISVTGRGLMRFVSECRPRSGKNGGAVLLVLLGCGLVLWAVGSIGVFFARIIQCSVARQRECLADASAVQFTRNPIGLANALKRIGATPLRNTLRCANRDELTHFLIAAGGGLSFDALFASHPPLLERIRLLDPSFTGDFKPWRIQTLTFDDLQNTPDRIAMREEGLLVGLDGGELSQATQFLQSLDQELRRTVAHPIDAAGVLYGLLLNGERDVRERQLGRIVALEGQPLAVEAQKWQNRLRGESRERRRMLAEMAVEGLRQRDPSPRATCVRLARELIDMDGQVSLFEHMLVKRIELRLDPQGGRKPFRQGPVLPAAQAQVEASLVLGTLAYAGQPEDDFLARGAWWLGSGNMPSFDLGELIPVRSTCTMEAFERALVRLSALSPQAKGELVAGCAAVIAEDGQRTSDETELLRAVCDLLEMPLPAM